jgi:hypothetical protein
MQSCSLASEALGCGIQSLDQVKGTKATRLMERVRISLGARHDEPIAPQQLTVIEKIELFNQQRRDMVKCGCHDCCGPTGRSGFDKQSLYFVGAEYA